MKKLISILLALVLALSMGTAAFALSGTAADKNGKISVENPIAGESYDYYRIFDLESYDTENEAFVYTVNAAWADFIAQSTVKGVYVNVDDQGYVTWVENASAADFAKLALAYAKANGVAKIGTLDSSNRFTAEKLALGYYLVDSSTGALCALDTTRPTATLKEKNEAPEDIKTVEEDSTGEYGAINDADIGQTVNFKSTITVQAGAENYVMHDVMSKGLSWDGTVTVTYDGSAVDAANYTLIKPAADAALADKCTFEVAFDNAWLATLTAGKPIVVAYSAVVNEGAVVAGAGNPNEVTLTYGDKNSTNKTPVSKTVTYTWKVDFFKFTYTGEDESRTQKPLSGAEFTVYKTCNAENGKKVYADPIALVALGENVYRVAVEDDSNTITAITTDDTGRFTVQGLDTDTYYLVENTAPKGYNKLEDAITFVIAQTEDNDGNVSAQVSIDNNVVKTVEVENNSGAVLPSTGGIGTTVFYIVGSVLLLGASVLLITKKRMGSEK